MLAATMAFTMCACGNDSGSASADGESGSPLSFKVATTQASSGLWVKYMTEAYEEISERTNGDLQFQIYPDSELGTNNDCLEQILAGAPIILGCGFDTLADYSDELAIASAPYVLQNEDDVFKLAESDWWKTTTEGLAENQNIQIFSVGTLGYRHFIGTKPIESPDDIKKMIVRMGSDFMRNWISVMSGSPASGAWADNYSSLQTGIFDACEATLDLLWSSSLYEVCDYLSLSGHSVNPNISIMSTESWNSIPAEYQEIITEVLQETMSKIYEETAASESQIVEDFKGKGVEVIEVDKSLFAPYTADLIEAEGMDSAILDDINAALGR